MKHNLELTTVETCLLAHLVATEMIYYMSLDQTADEAICRELLRKILDSVKN